MTEIRGVNVWAAIELILGLAVFVLVFVVRMVVMEFWGWKRKRKGYRPKHSSRNRL